MNSKIALLLVIFLWGCSTAQKTAQPKPKETFSITMDQKNQCLKRLKYFKLLAQQNQDKKYQQLFAKHDPETYCYAEFSATKKFMDFHQDKIGIIIESSADYENKTDAIIAGIKASVENVVHKTKGSFIIRKVPRRKEKVNQIISELVLDQKVGMLISWGEASFVKHVQRWQKSLDIPGLYISNKIEKHNNSFNIFPSRKNYALEFIENLKRKDIKKIAILTPDHLQATPLLKLLKFATKGKGVEIVHDITYQKGNYAQYETICRELFEIDPVARKDELDLIFAQEELKAQAQGLKLNPKHVFLPAKVNFDAIFIPDDFKTVLYFTKIFDYYQAQNVQLIGTYQWRSHELISSGEKLLEGATFIDFLGDYDKLPIEVPRFDNQKVINKGFRTDYKLMGYYAGLIGQVALKASAQNKEFITEELKNLKLNDGFISNQKVFQKNQFNWPSFAIEVRNNKFLVQDHY